MSYLFYDLFNWMVCSIYIPLKIKKVTKKVEIELLEPNGTGFHRIMFQYL